jgi:hypothetical protein
MTQPDELAVIPIDKGNRGFVPQGSAKPYRFHFGCGGFALFVTLLRSDFPQSARAALERSSKRLVSQSG